MHRATQDKDILFTVNDGGVTKTTLMTIDGSTGQISALVMLAIQDLIVTGNFDSKRYNTQQFNTTTLYV